MNLLDKRIGLIIFSALLLWRCEDPLSISLEDDRNTDQFGVFYREVEIPSSVLRVDSILTSQEDFLLVGYRSDDLFGEVRVTSYSEAQLGSTNLTLKQDSAFFDSLVLQLPVSYWMGQFPSTNNSIEVYQLADTFQSETNYTFTTLPTEDQPIGAITFDADPNEDSLFRISLDEAVGQDLFQKALDEDTIFRDQRLFAKYFKGLALVPGQTGDAIMGMNPENTRMIMYYHEINSNGTLDTLQFNFLIDRSLRFHNIQNDRTGTAIEGLSEPYQEIWPGDGKLYVHEGIGIMTKLYVDSAMQILRDSLVADTLNPDVILINRADLLVGVEPYGDYLDPPGEMRLVFTDENNRALSDGLGRFLQVQQDYAPQNGNDNPLRVLFDPTVRYYNADIGSYLQAVLNGTNENTRVLMYPGAISYRMDRLTVTRQNLKFRIYFTIPNS